AEIERILNRHGPRREAVFADPLPPCRTEAEILSVDEPLALEEKLLFRAAERSPGGRVARVLGTIELHERSHLADAASLLPLGSRPRRALGLLARAGGSPALVGGILEERAELGALAASPETEIVLAGTVSAARAAGFQDPHSLGYRRLLDSLVRRVRD